MRFMHLLEWRKSKGLTIAQAAERVKAEPSLFSKWERGVCRPDLESAVRILKGTNDEVTLMDLATFGPSRRDRKAARS
jgi:transcriptional regulator with XRE-family HTH domain